MLPKYYQDTNTNTIMFTQMKVKLKKI